MGASVSTPLQQVAMDVPLIEPAAQEAPAVEAAPVVREQPSRGEKFAYDFDVWYSSNGAAEIWMLVAVNVFFLTVLFILFAITGSGTDLSGLTYVSEMVWMSWGQLGGKAPKAMDPDGAVWPTRAVRTFAAFSSMFAFSLIVGFVKSALKGMLKSIKMGKGRVLEKGFSMVIGWNDRVLPLCEQLCMANESGAGGIIVVMAPKSKPFMDGFFMDNIEDKLGSTIITRKGDPINPNDLMKCAAPFARSIVVLSQGEDADEADAQACRCVLALSGGMPFLDGHVVVEPRDIDNEPVCIMGVDEDKYPDPIERKRRILPVVGNDLIGKLMVQCSIEPGLARCFCHILAFVGNEFYFKEWPELVGKRFADACFMFNDAIVIGLRLAVQNEMGAYIILNPPGMEEIQAGDQLLVIAGDDDTYYPGELKLTNCGAPPDYDEEPPAPSKTLLIGWRRDIQDMVMELDKWVAPGSACTMMFSGDYEHDAGTGTDAAKQELNDNGLDWEGVGVEDCEALTNMTLAFCETDPTFYGKLASGRGELDENPVNLWEYDSILVLTEGHRGQEGLTSDSRTMITTLLCRHIQKECAEEGRVTFRGNNPTTSFVIPEISDPRTSALLGLAKAQDFIVSGDLISMALGQMSEEADIHQLLADLFSPEGNEMHIKDVRLYVTAGETLSFWEIMNRARQRCEVALGYFRPGMAEPIINPGSETSDGSSITPDKSVRITWRSGDQIVVIAED